jgi:hypothetical protein
MINDETGEVEGGPAGLKGKSFERATSQGLESLRRDRGPKGTLGDRARRVEAGSDKPYPNKKNLPEVGTANFNRFYLTHGGKELKVEQEGPVGGPRKTVVSDGETHREFHHIPERGGQNKKEVEDLLRQHLDKPEIETKNPGRGYHGELQTTKHLGKSEDDPAIKADYAKAHSWLKSNAPAGHSDDEIRAFLDSSAGRHFADTVARSGDDLNKVNPKEVFNSAFRNVVKAHRNEQREDQDQKTEKAAEIRRHVEEKTSGTPAQKEFHIARVQHKNGFGPEPGHEDLHKKFDEIDKTSRAHIEKNFGHLPKTDQERQIERISNKQKMALAPKASDDATKASKSRSRNYYDSADTEETKAAAEKAYEERKRAEALSKATDATQAARAAYNDKTLQGDPGLNARHAANVAQEKQVQQARVDSKKRNNRNYHDSADSEETKAAAHKAYVAKTATNKAVEASSKATAASTDIDRVNSHKAAKEAHAIASIAARQAGDHKSAETHEKAVKDHTALEDRFTKKVRKRFPG